MRTAHISLVFILLAAPAAAQTQSTNCPHPSAQKAALTPAVMAARQAEHQACAADMARFCANVPRGCGRPVQCLREHSGALSQTCTGAMAQLHAARVQSHAASAAAQH
jgi:hypothetical protein